MSLMLCKSLCNFMHRLLSRAAFVLAMITLVTSATLAQAPGRPLRGLTIDDVLRLEGVGYWGAGGIVISPDGGGIAYVRCLPILAHRLPSLPCSDSATSVWMTTGDGANATRVDPLGAASASRPAFSPDGRHLALLVMNVRDVPGGLVSDYSVWTRERATGTTRKLVENVADPAALSNGRAFEWVDSSTLLVAVRTPGRSSDEDNSRVSVVKAWEAYARATHTTASTLDSGGPQRDDEPKRVKVVLVNLSGRTRTVQNSSENTIGQLSVSPRRDLVAMERRVAMPDVSSQPVLKDVGMGGGELTARYQLGIASVERATCVWGAAFVGSTIRWLRSGRGVVFVGTPADRPGDARQVFQALLDGETLRIVRLAELSPRAMVTASRDRVLVKASGPVAGANPLGREDWWLLAENAAPRNLTVDLKDVPAGLVAQPGGGTFVGVAGGQIWQLDLDSLQWTSRSNSNSPRVDAIRWPLDDIDPNNDEADRFVVSSGRPAAYFRYDASEQTLQAIAKPSPDAQLVRYSPVTDARIFLDESRKTVAVSVVQGERITQVMELNGFLKDVAEGETRKIEYRSSDGEPLTAWLILPVGYEVGKRYPMITKVYHGALASLAEAALTNAAYGNLQLFAARGYAVLIPSMPTGKGQLDPFLELSSGVLPAVDKAIELGIADPDRLAVYGMSNGGYSVYGLITQTRRFAAAMAFAGMSDLASAYGTFSNRYERNPHETLYMARIFEERFDVHPQRDLWRYLRNSPVFYADRVQTPTLIVQGEADPVPISQGEEFFTALYRQGTRARFVRYLGERHGIFSAPNMRDVWEQMIRWLDECFGERHLNESHYVSR